MAIVDIEYNENVFYPQYDESCYGPSVCFPELTPYYSEKDCLPTNMVYSMVRNTLIGLDLDKKNFGCKTWNPLGDVICPGDTVLVKPNLVRHVNLNPNYGMDCLITHPSVIRPIIDYIVLALKGDGQIIIGDAPVQGCDFTQLVRSEHYCDLVNFYSKKGVPIELYDFRILGLGNPVYEMNNFICRDAQIDVNLGFESAHLKDEESRHRLRITNYLPKEMQYYHTADESVYCFAKKVLDADVIINVPKPKTHRKAGVTAALKNMIGCIAKKECLPHHKVGSLSEGGDEYQYKSHIKQIRTFFSDISDWNSFKLKSIILGVVCKQLQIAFGAFSRFFSKDSYSEGSWYGNDTIWRTISDVNRIIHYADKRGIMRFNRQRKMICISDMIIAGEGEGPLLPSSRHVGCIVGSSEQIPHDIVIAELMGIDPVLIPSLSRLNIGEKYRLPDSGVMVRICGKDTRFEEIKMIMEKSGGKFLLSSGWGPLYEKCASVQK